MRYGIGTMKVIHRKSNQGRNCLLQRGHNGMAPNMLENTGAGWPWPPMYENTGSGWLTSTQGTLFDYFFGSEGLHKDMDGWMDGWLDGWMGVVRITSQ